MKRKECIEKVINYLGWLSNRVRLNNSIYLTDINRNAEDFYCELLNLVYGFNLVNLNTIKANNPAIDLGDKEKGIAVQITSTSSLKKTKDTIKKFYKHGLFQEYKRLIIFNIVKKAKHQSQYIGDKYKLNTKEDIWDIEDLIKTIADKPKTEDLIAIADFLTKELNINSNLKDSDEIEGFDKYIRYPNPSIYNKKTWVGRSTLVNNLVNKVNKGTRIVFLSGISGVGKTTLAEHIAVKSWKKKPFNWISYSLANTENYGFGIEAYKLLKELGIKDIDPKEMNNSKMLSNRLYEELKDNYYWIQIDALEKLLISDVSNELVCDSWYSFFQRCLSSSNFYSRIVITSQILPASFNRFDDEYSNRWHQTIVKGLEIKDQSKLFRKAGIVTSELNKFFLDSIGKAYEGHPLVLKIIAKQIMADPFKGDVRLYWERYQSEFLEILGESKNKDTSNFIYNTELERRVSTKVRDTIKRLPERVRDLLCRSSVYRYPVPEAFWLAMINEYTLNEQKEAYLSLSDWNFIEKKGVGKDHFLLCQHNLIRNTALKLLNEGTAKSIWKLSEERAATQWLNNYTPDKAASNIDEIRGYLEAFYHFSNIGNWQECKEILLTPIDSSIKRELYWMLGIWGFYHEQIYICERILDKYDEEIDSICFNAIGLAYKELGDYTQAINNFRKRISLAQKNSDAKGEGNSLGNLGLVHWMKGDYEEAIKCHTQSLAISIKIFDRQGIGEDLGNLGLVYRDKEDYVKAICCTEKYLVIARRTKHRIGEQRALNNLGYIYLGLEKYEKALDYFCQSLDISREISNRLGEGISLSNIGEALIEVNKFPVAYVFLKQSLKVAEEIDDNLGKAYCFKHLAVLHYKINDLTNARNYCDSALQIANELDVSFAKECLQLKEQLFCVTKEA